MWIGVRFESVELKSSMNFLIKQPINQLAEKLIYDEQTLEKTKKMIESPTNKEEEEIANSRKVMDFDFSFSF